LISLSSIRSVVLLPAPLEAGHAAGVDREGEVAHGLDLAEVLAGALDFDRAHRSTP
jgi:hypothetical protein